MWTISISSYSTEFHEIWQVCCFWLWTFILIIFFLEILCHQHKYSTLNPPWIWLSIQRKSVTHIQLEKNQYFILSSMWKSHFGSPNNSINAINASLLMRLPGNITSYKSINMVLNLDEVVHYPIEFLNSLESSGIPPHVLQVKLVAPIMLIRNLNPLRPCNSMRLSVIKLLQCVIETTVISGCGWGNDVFIPWISLEPSGAALTFTFCVTLFISVV